MSRVATRGARGAGEAGGVGGPERRYRGKPPAVRLLERRERILLAARDVFAARGFAGATLEEIVALARVSRTSFYEQFESKAQCLLAVFDLGVRRVGEAVVEAAIRSRGEPAARIRAMVEAIAGAFASDPAMARVVLIGVIGAGPEAERARVDARRLAATYVERLLSEYPAWRERGAGARHAASVATMAAVAEPLSELAGSGRLDEWESLVDPVADFLGRALII